MKKILNLFSRILHAHQYIVAKFLQKSKAKYKIFCCGRTYGKSFLLIEILKEKANLKNKVIYFISQTYEFSGEFYDLLFKAFEYSDFIVAKKRGKFIQLKNGTIIKFYSYDNYDNLRGHNNANFIFLDEAAKLCNNGWEEVLQYCCDPVGVIEVYLCSTPKGKNWFYRVALQASQNSNYELIRASTYDNPLLTPLAKERLDSEAGTDRHRQETLAEFIDDGGEVFPNVSNCFVLPTYKTLGKGEDCFAGVDIARFNDWTVITVLNSKKELVYFDRFQQQDMQLIADKIMLVIKKFCCKIAIERNNQGIIIIKLLKMMEKGAYGYLIKEFETQGDKGGVEGTKSIIVNELVFAFQLNEIKLLKKENNRNMREAEFELNSFEQHTTPKGATTYKGHGKTHDDIVISLALANHLTNKHIRTFKIK